MYNKIVVPLDGSDLAEVALPHVAEIGKGCNVPLVLLVSVTQPVKARVSSHIVAGEYDAREYHVAPSGGPIPTGNYLTGLLYSPDMKNLKDIPAEVGKMAKTAWNYLSKKAEELEQQGLHTEIRVAFGHPAEEIIRFAEDEKADLIIMGSRGRSGFNQWDMGNIADKVVRTVNVPVLLVKPQSGFKETKPKRRGRPS
jgi:nucleotide-binding universal stress UspA family protein